MILLALGAAAWAVPLWTDATAGTIGVTAEWSNKVEVADVDGDGLLDVVFANGAGYSSPDAREPVRVFLNAGSGLPFTEISLELGLVGYARVVKVRDVDQDGANDLVVGNAFGDEARLLLGDGLGGFTDASLSLPQVAPSIGDLEVGDVDADGDLDLALVDWGPGDAFGGNGFVRIWLADGFGAFSEAPAAQVPATRIAFSWDLELEDVDNDFDLDVLVSSKESNTSFLFRNDGAGTFVDDTSLAMPHYTNNYELEAMDVSGDGFVDLVTINDGPGLDEHLLLNDGAGSFTDGTPAWWPGAANIGQDDNCAVFLDFDSDGDADFLIGALSSHDRLLVNEGATLSLADEVVSGASTFGTLGLALGDLDGDGRIDLAMAQGELADPDKVYLAGVDVPVDTAAPTIAPVETFVGPVAGPVTVHARVSDRKTPVLASDFQSVELTWTPDGGAAVVAPMAWYGGSGWRATIDVTTDGTYSVCATDRAGNAACSAPLALAFGAGPVDTGEADADTDADSDTDTDADTDTDTDTDSAPAEDEKGCHHGGAHLPPPESLVLLLALRRRRR